jgi:hypothetical protein
MAKIQQKKCHALPSTSQQKMPDVNPWSPGHNDACQVSPLKMVVSIFLDN